MTTASRPPGSRAAAALGTAVAILGAALGLLSAAMAASGGDWRWLILLLPSLGLMKLGSMVYRGRLNVSMGKRKRRPPEARRSPVQDFAHHNKAWDNVARWEHKYGEGPGSEDRINSPQRKLESWRLRLKR